MSNRIETLSAIMEQFQSDPELKEMLEKMTAEVAPALEAGVTYYSTPVKSKYGTSGGGVFVLEGSKAIREGLGGVEDALSGLPYGCNQMSVMSEFPAQTKVRFTFRKGEPVLVEPYGVELLLEDAKRGILEHYAMRPGATDSEGLIRFVEQGEDLGMDVAWTNTIARKRVTVDHAFGCSDEVEAIYRLLDGKITAMYMKFDGETLLVQTEPALPEYNIPALTVTEVPMAKPFREHRAAALEARSKRLDFYKSLGELHDTILYLNVGGFGDSIWPAYSSALYSAKMRIIHTKDSTLLITDGLSDLYNNPEHKEVLKRNGLGLELYAEFGGRIEFEDLNYHFMITLLNAMAQSTIGHGSFAAYMKKRKTTTVQFELENLEEYTLREEVPVNQVDSFFPEFQYKKRGLIGLLLGMDSKNVPGIMPLNLEEVLLVSVKPFPEKWLSDKKLGADDDQLVDAVRAKLIKQFEAEDGGNLLREDYLGSVSRK